jgi:glycosyltransferase involved in cell wall biosynthesis
MIDVIFPFHRNDQFLIDAVDSLLSSKGVKIRVIIVDDRTHKEKNFSKVFAKFENYEYIHTGGGKGYGECLKIGSHYLNSEFTALMNSDDTIHAERFIRQLKMLDSSEISISKMNRINANDKRINPLLGDVTSSNYNSAFLLLGAYGANASWCMHREWWLSNAFFDNEQCLDWRIALISFPSSNISYTNYPLYNYRKHSNQVTSLRYIPNRELDSLYLAWVSYLSLLLPDKFSRDVFNLVATPWNNNSVLDIDEYLNFRRLILLKIKDINPEIFIDFTKLIKRRDITTIRKSTGILTRTQLMAKCYSEFISVGKDILCNFIK